MDTRAPRQCNTWAYRYLLTAFAIMMTITTVQVEAADNGTHIEHIGPASWTSTQDPYHTHSGHILTRKGSVLYIELDLLNIQTIMNSNIHFNGTLYHYTTSGPNHVVDNSTIALLSCDGDHAGENFVRTALLRPKAIILYTDEGNCCIFKSNYWQSMGTGKPFIFTFANMKLINPPDILSYERTPGTSVHVEYWAHFDRSITPPGPSDIPPVYEQNSPHKGSAMLIVYIIVSLIAAGFLAVILFLGMKVCKRSGGEPTQNPRARPRQSRARGIARAALDTLPVVKFGSKPSEPIPKDLEMQDGTSSLGTGGSMMEVRSDIGEQATSSPPAQEGEHHRETTTSVGTGNPPTVAPPTIIPFRGVEVPAASEPDPNQVRCPVCLEDFEEDQEVRVLPCSHSFHTDCIDPWLLNVAGSCPLCRIDLRSPEERERDNLASIIPPPPPALTARPRSSSTRAGRLQALLDVARRNSSREERLAALRAVRDVSENGHSRRTRRSRMPELGVSRLRQAVFGSSRNNTVGHDPSLRTGASSARLVHGSTAPGVHSPSSSTTGLR